MPTISVEIMKIIDERETQKKNKTNKQKNNKNKDRKKQRGRKP